jgi:hypothetical protein
LAVSAEDWGAVTWVSNGLWILVLCCLLFSAKAQAQYLPQIRTLNEGEEITYDVYFKWGILMSRAGEGKISFRQDAWQGTTAFRYGMTFHTGKFFDSIYKMRDTIDCYYAPDYSLRYSVKHSDEGGYYLTDELTFSYPDAQQTGVHVLQYTPEKVKADTMLTVPSGYVFDMLGAYFFLRTWDWKELKAGDVFPSTVVAGHDLVKISFRYQGIATVERDNIKYRTRHFSLDIYDKAFTQSKSAAELWVGDDENHLAIKLRSKLKIGYLEIYLKNSVNLKTPLNCQVKE